MNAPGPWPDTSLSSEIARIASINAVFGEERLSSSRLARCVAPTLVALDWFGASQRLAGSLPAEGEIFGISDLQKLLSEQGFRVQQFSWRQWRRRYRGNLERLPNGSILVSGESVRVYLGRVDGSDWWHDGAVIGTGEEPTGSETLLLIEPDGAYLPVDAPQAGWLNRLLVTARRELGGVMLISLVANLLALAIPVFTMFVYNTVIPSGDAATLWSMAIGAVIFVLGAWGLRLARTGLVSRLTAWAGQRVGDVSLRKTLGLPADVTARIGVDNNLIRLRSVEGVRQWFGGGGGTVNVDYPFILVFLFAIAVIGGWLVVVPLIGVLLLSLLSLPMRRIVEARSGDSGRISRRLGEMTTVVSARLRALRGVRGSTLWMQHLAALVAQSVAARSAHARANAMMMVVGQGLGSLTVLSTLAVGITLVLDGVMNPGGLIATMMLIWRVTGPAQQMFVNQTRMQQIMNSGRQLDRLLTSAGEASDPQIQSPVAKLEPRIFADRLYYRYRSDREPALNGVGFEVEAGSIVAVAGPNGAGKSTLLSVLAGARLPQSGRICVDGRDIRQFDPADYRRWHGYVPQSPPSLPLTLRDSLRLRDPLVSDRDLKTVLEWTAGADWFRHFGADNASDGLQFSATAWRDDGDALRQRYIAGMAAALLGSPPLLLLDDPLGDMDPELDGYLSATLDRLRGQCTVIMATHRADLIQRSDMIAVLNDGALAHFGPVGEPESGGPVS
ncbi:ATP-binding cassette domain-containing protein [Hyphomonas sp.]|uniref:ATP-binding cassette domain-containing protein n=1 Tax=Hyphomonas sp. TaxID=87 RepID=UPI002627F721|nr:ATP-binding cassette domain-containing protein [Hyphomonas sp.]MDF1807277.1 ATP-binding cassette domain-containing protein [Hyphomonas sp.]